MVETKLKQQKLNDPKPNESEIEKKSYAYLYIYIPTISQHLQISNSYTIDKEKWNPRL